MDFVFTHWNLIMVALVLLSVTTLVTQQYYWASTLFSGAVATAFAGVLLSPAASTETDLLDRGLSSASADRLVAWSWVDDGSIMAHYDCNGQKRARWLAATETEDYWVLAPLQVEVATSLFIAKSTDKADAAGVEPAPQIFACPQGNSA